MPETGPFVTMLSELFKFPNSRLIPGMFQADKVKRQNGPILTLRPKAEKPALGGDSHFRRYARQPEWSK